MGSGCWSGVEKSSKFNARTKRGGCSRRGEYRGKNQCWDGRDCAENHKGPDSPRVQRVKKVFCGTGEAVRHRNLLLVILQSGVPS